MALQKDIILNNNIEVKGAYIKIDTISGFKGGLDIGVNFYVSQQSFLLGKGYVERKEYSFIPSVEDDSDNFIKQGYEYLKTLDEYVNALDC